MTNDEATNEGVIAAFCQSPHREALLVAGDFNPNFAEPESN